MAVESKRILKEVGFQSYFPSREEQNLAKPQDRQSSLAANQRMDRQLAEVVAEAEPQSQAAVEGTADHKHSSHLGSSQKNHQATGSCLPTIGEQNLLRLPAVVRLDAVAA